MNDSQATEKQDCSEGIGAPVTGAGRGNKARSFSDRADRLGRIIVALFLRGTCQLRLPSRSLEESLLVLEHLTKLEEFPMLRDVYANGQHRGRRQKSSWE